jgi:hypothetical protein
VLLQRLTKRPVKRAMAVIDRLVEFFVRANGYSLAVVLGVPFDDVGDNGPGSFSGPFVDGA